MTLRASRSVAFTTSRGLRLAAFAALGSATLTLSCSTDGHYVIERVDVATIPFDPDPEKSEFCAAFVDFWSAIREDLESFYESFDVLAGRLLDATPSDLRDTAQEYVDVERLMMSIMERHDLDLAAAQADPEAQDLGMRQLMARAGMQNAVMARC